MKIKVPMILLFVICTGVNQLVFGMELIPAEKRIWFKCGEKRISIKNNADNWDILKQSVSLKSMFEDLGCVEKTFENLDNPISLQGVNNKKEFTTIFRLMKHLHGDNKERIETKLKKSVVQELCPLAQTCNFYSISSKTINLTAAICKAIADKYNSKTDQLCVKPLPFDLCNLIARYRVENCITYIDHHGKALTSFGNNKIILSTAFSPDGKRLAIGSLDTTANIWDLETEECKKTFFGHSEAIFSVAFSPNGKNLATVSGDKTAKIWDLETGQCTRTFIGHFCLICSVVFNSDGKHIATGSRDETATIWDLETGKRIKTFVGHTGFIYSLAFSPDDKYLITGSLDNTVKMWDLETEECIKTFVGHTGPIYSLVFSPNGKIFATGSADGTAKIWNIETNHSIKNLVGHASSIRSLAFHPDGKSLATGSGDKTAKIWDIETGQCKKTFIRHPDLIYSLAYSPDGKILVTGSMDTARIWNVDDTTKQILLNNLTMEQADFLIEKIYPVIKQDQKFECKSGDDEHKIFMTIGTEAQRYLVPYITIINQSKK